MIGTSTVQWTTPEEYTASQSDIEILAAVGSSVVDVPVLLQSA